MDDDFWLPVDLDEIKRQKEQDNTMFANQMADDLALLDLMDGEGDDGILDMAIATSLWEKVHSKRGQTPSYERGRKAGRFLGIMLVIFMFMCIFAEAIRQIISGTP